MKLVDSIYEAGMEIRVETTLHLDNERRASLQVRTILAADGQDIYVRVSETEGLLKDESTPEAIEISARIVHQDIVDKLREHPVLRFAFAVCALGALVEGD